MFHLSPFQQYKAVSMLTISILQKSAYG